MILMAKALFFFNVVCFVFSNSMQPIQDDDFFIDFGSVNDTIDFMVKVPISRYFDVIKGEYRFIYSIIYFIT